MLIAETTDVREAYPHARPEAVEHLMWALHRLKPVVDAGNVDAAIAGLRADLADYSGELSDFDVFDVRNLFRALAAGRVAFADTLIRVRLGRAERSPVRYVVVGPLLEVRLWARERCIGQNTIIAILRSTDVFKLRGLSGHGVSIVRLPCGRPDPVVEDALTALIRAGAQQVPADWRPGADPDPQARCLDLRAAMAPPLGA